MNRVSFGTSILILAAALAAGPALATTANVVTDRSTDAVEAIRAAQAILEHDGLLTPGSYAPGHLDAATVAAIRAFQVDHYLAPTGRLDPDTTALLVSHGPAAPERLAESAAEPEETARLAAQIETDEPVAAQEAAQAAGAPERTMPRTGVYIPASVLLGALFAGAGVLLLRRVA